MPTLQERYDLKGSVISAVDLIRGLGIYAGLRVIHVPGATGYVDTNYQGKAEAALYALERDDLVYVHVEAPDEAGHQGDLQKKIRAIEDFGAKIVGPIVAGLKPFGEYSILLLSDHPTPVSLRVHKADPVPFVIYCSRDAQSPHTERAFSEASAQASGLYLADGYRLFGMLLQR